MNGKRHLERPEPQQAPGRPGKPRRLIRRVYSTGKPWEGTDFERIFRCIDEADELLVVTVHGLGSIGLDSIIAYAANTEKPVRWVEEWLGALYYVPANERTKDGTPLCQATATGLCRWAFCPQLDEREPATSGRRCPRWQAEIDAGLWSTE